MLSSCICCRSYIIIISQDRQAQNKDKRQRLAAALESGQRIIIDLDFADLMTDQVTRYLQRAFVHESCKSTCVNSTYPSQILCRGCMRFSCMQELHCLAQQRRALHTL